MNVILDMLETPDPALFLLIGLLAFVAAKMTAGRPDLKRWGNRCSAAAFIIYSVYGIDKFKPEDAVGFLNVAFSALVCAALVATLSRVGFAMCAFIASTPASLFQRWFRTTQKQLATGRMEREHLMKTRRDRELYDESAPERERARQEAAELAQVQAYAQKRRATARAQCEFLYHLYSPEIESRFPRNKFDDFVGKHLNDREAPDDVEFHAGQLRALLDSHVKKADPRSRFKTLGELANWYQDQQRHLRDSSLDPTTMEVLLINLEVQYEQKLRQFIQES